MRKRLRRSTLTVRKFDVEYTREMFKKNTRALFEGAAMEFVQTAAPMFPSLTGQAKAAVVNIAKSLGLNPKFHAFSPPISEYEHLQVPLWLLGNLPVRGETMGYSRIQEYKNSMAWQLTLDITAAHNGFEYFTYWDGLIWHSIDAALNSAADFIEMRKDELVVVKVNNYDRTN